MSRAWIVAACLAVATSVGYYIRNASLTTPEDDPLATRTLFVGNLELNITDEEIQRIFGRYGKLVDIDIKRPPPGTGQRSRSLGASSVRGSNPRSRR